MVINDSSGNNANKGNITKTYNNGKKIVTIMVTQMIKLVTYMVSIAAKE